MPWVILDDKVKKFERFYAEHYEKVFRFVRARRFPYNHISDLVGKIFEKAWLRFDEYLTGHKQKYWIYDIARDTCKYEWHRARKKGEYLSEDVEAVLSSPVSGLGSSVEEDALRNEWREQFLRIVLELPEKQRVVVMMKLEGYNYVEMAKILKISQQACRKRMLKAIDVLKEPLTGLLRHHPEILSRFLSVKENK